MDDDPPPGWKARLENGRVAAPFEHYTVLADGVAGVLSDGFVCRPGRAVMGVKVWASSPGEATDMVVVIGREVGFQAAGRAEIYETEATEPPREGPYAYDIGFTPYDEAAKQASLPTILYAAAAVVAVILAWVQQPRFCLDHLYLPWLLPALVALCVACAAMHGLSRWRPAVQVAVAAVFAAAIQATPVIPCVSSLQEVPELPGLVAFGWYMAWALAVVLAVAAAGLLHGDFGGGARAVAALGLALASVHFALGATKQYLRANGSLSVDAFAAIAEVRTPVWLMTGAVVALVGLTVAQAQRWRRSITG